MKQRPLWRESEGDTMNDTPDTTAAAGNGGNFDPRQAAALLDQTTQQARRKFAPPAVAPGDPGRRGPGRVGAVWLSRARTAPRPGPDCRGHPHLVAFIVLNFGATVAVRERAIDRGTRQDPAAPGRDHRPGAGMGRRGRAHVGAGRRRGELRLVPHHGADRPRPGLGGHHGGPGDWPACGTGLAVAAVGAVGAFAGPAGRGRSPAWACAPCCWATPPPSPGGSAHDGVP